MLNYVPNIFAKSDDLQETEVAITIYMPTTPGDDI